MAYSKEEVYEKSLAYFKGDPLATNVWIDKYCLKDTKGQLLEVTPNDMHKRLASEFSRIENKYPNPISEAEIFTLLDNFKYFIPAGSPMYGIGNNHSIVSISNCFFIGNNGDSYSSILRTDQEAVQLYKRRGGVGLDISHLRPSGASVSNSAGSSTGAVSFMNRFSESARECGQQGRRAALMITLDVAHPDIEEFIIAKSNVTNITGANISVKLDDTFMKAVETNSTYLLKYPTNLEGDLISTNQGKVMSIDIEQFTGAIPQISWLEMDAKKIWDKLVEGAYNNGEPGFLYWSTIQRESPSDCYHDFKVKGVNPCSEITLSESECCRLGHINLASFVKNPFNKDASFDFSNFRRVVNTSYRLMDDLVDLDIEKIDKIIAKINSDPEDDITKVVELQLWRDIKDKTIRGRRVGLGYTALGDVLGSLGIKYSSIEGIEMTSLITQVLAIYSYKSSIQLAKERGAFPEWSYNNEKDNPFIYRLFDGGDYSEDFIKYGRRNITSLTLAPTGSTSLMANNCSSGIEPVYQLHYKRRRKVPKDHSNVSFIDKKGDSWEEYSLLHPKFLEWIKAWKGDFLIEDITDNELEKWSKESPFYNSTALEIDPLDKIQVIAAAQEWIDAAISNTLNFNKNATKETMSKAAMLAWKLGLKGFSAYREGSRDGVLISSDSTIATEFKYHSAPKRPKELTSVLHTTRVNGIPYAIIIGLLEEKPYEIFCLPDYDHSHGNTIGTITKIKKGHFKFSSKQFTIDDINNQGEISERRMNLLLSGILRHGAHPKYLIKWIDKANWDITAYANAVKRIIRKYIRDEELGSNICPQCKENTLIYEGGCTQCTNPECGYGGCN